MDTLEQARFHRREYNRAWRADNIEHVREYERERARKIRATVEGRKKKNLASRKYARLHPEKRAAAVAAWYAKNPNYNRSYYEAHIRLAMFENARKRAAKKNIQFSISVDDIVIPEHCPVLGIKLNLGKNGFHPNSPSIDRFIPELGYVPTNIRVISNRANLLKRDATLDELKKIVAYMEQIK